MTSEKVFWHWEATEFQSAYITILVLFLEYNEGRLPKGMHYTAATIPYNLGDCLDFPGIPGKIQFQYVTLISFQS